MKEYFIDYTKNLEKLLLGILSLALLCVIAVQDTYAASRKIDNTIHIGTTINEDTQSITHYNTYRLIEPKSIKDRIYKL